MTAALSYIIIGFLIMQALVALSNIIFSSRLPRRINLTGSEPLVSVMIPARNEEDNIHNILQDLLNQPYLAVEILVFDDNSDDNTAAIVSDFSKNDTRVRLLQSDDLPEGWFGKNWACSSMAASASGEYLFFVDADARLTGDFIRRSLAFAEQKKVSFFSIFPLQVMRTSGELSVVPLMNYILLSLLPLVLVGKLPFSSLAAANGQYMFFRRDAYFRHLPHQRFRNSLVEDILIARYMKKQGERIACLTGDESVRCRMYKGYHDAIYGFAKNVAQFFGGSLIAALLFWIAGTAGCAVVGAGLGSAGLLTWFVLTILVRIAVSVASSQNFFLNVIYLIPQQLSLALIIIKAIVLRFKPGYIWKGRNLS